VPGTSLSKTAGGESLDVRALSLVALAVILPNRCGKSGEWAGILHKGYENGSISMGSMPAVELDNRVGTVPVLSCNAVYMLRMCMRILMDSDRVRRSLALRAKSASSFHNVQNLFLNSGSVCRISNSETDSSVFDWE
jgi:hypothetical protein